MPMKALSQRSRSLQIRRRRYKGKPERKYIADRIIKTAAVSLRSPVAVTSVESADPVTPVASVGFITLGLSLAVTVARTRAALTVRIHLASAGVGILFRCSVLVEVLCAVDYETLFLRKLDNEDVVGESDIVT